MSEAIAASEREAWQAAIADYQAAVADGRKALATTQRTLRAVVRIQIAATAISWTLVGGLLLILLILSRT